MPSEVAKTADPGVIRANRHTSTKALFREKASPEQNP